MLFAEKIGGFDLESFPYSNISSFEQSKNVMGHSISFFGSGNKVAMKWVKDGGRVQQFSQAVKEGMGRKPDHVQVQNGDLADQLKKLAELRDQGILTDDEFQAQKTKLLD